MAAINKQFLLQLNLFVLLAIMCQQKKRKKHRFWVREIFQKRQELGAYHRLIMERVVSFSVVFCRRVRIYPIPTTLSFSVYFCRCGSFNVTTKTLKDK